MPALMSACAMRVEACARLEQPMLLANHLDGWSHDACVKRAPADIDKLLEVEHDIDAGTVDATHVKRAPAGTTIRADAC